MAFLLSGERSTHVVGPLSPLEAIANWFRGNSQERTHRAALQALLDMDDDRLDDIGVSRGDVADALASGVSLSNRRAERARNSIWSR